MDQEVYLIPIMSGYRDEKSLSVDLITHYREIDKTIYLTLRQDEIISATEFDLNAYETFNTKKRVKSLLKVKDTRDDVQAVQIRCLISNDSAISV